MYHFPDNCQIPNLSSIYEKYFGVRNYGFFIEVGAYDGYNFSNTWGLAEAGWEGIYFEPVPEFYEKCLENHKNHPKIAVENFAIGQENKEITLNLAGPLSSADAEQTSLVSKLPWAKDSFTGRTIKARSIPLWEYMSEVQLYDNIDLLVIDVEGMELDVLKSANLSHIIPTMVIVEAHEHHQDVELRRNAKAINDYLSGFKYKKIYSDEINNIYVREDASIF